MLNFVVVFNYIWKYIYVSDTESLSQTYLRNFGTIYLFFAKKPVFINNSPLDQVLRFFVCCLFTFVYTYDLNTASLKKLFSENLG